MLSVMGVFDTESAEEEVAVYPSFMGTLEQMPHPDVSSLTAILVEHQVTA